MRLIPGERSRLIEAYQITVMGYHAYHRRKGVQDFLLSFSGGSAKCGENQIWHEYVTVNEQEFRKWYPEICR